MELERQTIGGRYRLLDVIASGGFGQVWRAHDDLLDVDVAIKQVRLDPRASDEERAKAAALARREAKNAAAVRDHPNIVAVHDVVIEAGLPWLVMRLVSGRSLAQELEARGPLGPQEAGRIAAGVLEALRVAHDAGIMHRDVKPANIMLTEDDRVLLTDFGIAKHSSDLTLTSTGMVVGSVAYMAPERFGGQGDPDSPAGDLFSLGATLFEMVEGRPPFGGDSLLATINAIGHAPTPATPHAGHLAPLITELLAKDPMQRPDTDAALLMLESYGTDTTQTAIRLPPKQAPAGRAGPTEPMSPVNPADPADPAERELQVQRHRRKLRYSLIAVLGLVVAAAGTTGIVWGVHEYHRTHDLRPVSCTVLPRATTDALHLQPGTISSVGMSNGGFDAGVGCFWDGPATAIGSPSAELSIRAVQSEDSVGASPLDFAPDSYAKLLQPGSKARCDVFWKTAFGFYEVEYSDYIGGTDACPTAESIAKQAYPRLPR